MPALDDRPRPGREATITAEAKAWVVDLACRKAKELGYPHQTRALLASWNDGPAKQAILDFVRVTTDPSRDVPGGGAGLVSTRFERAILNKSEIVSWAP